jgi:hypothetical protein
MDDTPNEEFSYAVDPEGKLGILVTSIYSIDVVDHEKNFIKTVIVEDCKTYGEIRQRDMAALLTHYLEEGYSPSECASLIHLVHFRVPEEVESFLKKNLPGY